MKYFCLHHPLLENRKTKLELTFNQLNIDAEWVVLFSPDDIEFPLDHSFKNIQEYSLYLKHQYCFEQQIKNNYNYIVIFEDDVILPDNFLSHLNQCIFEFENLNGDILFLGTCCDIKPTNILPGKCVYHEDNFLSRCAHCYLLTLDACKIIYPYLLNNQKAFDFKLNDIIIHEKLKSCYAEPGILQGTNSKIVVSSLGN